MCSSLISDFIRKHSCSSRHRHKYIIREYYDADEYAYEICSWVGRRSPDSTLQIRQTLDSMGISRLVYKSPNEARSAGRIDMRLYCESMQDVPDQGLVVELNIYRRQAVRCTMPGPWMLSERVCARQEDILRQCK